MEAQRVLVLTYHWPPFGGAGANRWMSLSRHLRKLGHEVTVVTTPVFGTLSTDHRDGVLRTRDLADVGALRRMLRRPGVAAVESERPAAQKPPSVALTRVMVPDAFAVSWVPFATLAARRQLRGRRFDCVITSSPPDSVHLAGLALGRRRPAWVADMRDGWMFEPLRPRLPTSFQRRLDARLERAVARRADAVVCATGPIADDLRIRLGVDAETIRNAWDPDLEAVVAAASPPPLDGERVNLVYTGSLGGIRGHDDRGLIEALRQIVRSDPAVADRLRLVIAGPLTEAEERMLSAPDLSPVVSLVGRLSHPEALALQRSAQALLLITSHDTSIATGKLFEYLAADRPVLALAGPNEAARIIAETGTGSSVAPDDVTAIRRALASVVSGKLAAAYEPRGLGQYRYPGPAIAYAETIARAVERRATSR